MLIIQQGEKDITVDQSKVLKIYCIYCFVFGGHPVCIYNTELMFKLIVDIM